MSTTTVILITGHPATGKTTLAHCLAQELCLPLIWKDQIKESLLDILGYSTAEWSRKLGVATWELLYQQIENLLQANVSHIVESNFDPIYANGRWQSLHTKYNFQLVQIRCETEPETLLKRYHHRIKQGNRHAGHVDDSNNASFIKSVQQHMEWIAIESDMLSFDTTELTKADCLTMTKEVKKLT